MKKQFGFLILITALCLSLAGCAKEDRLARQEAYTAAGRTAMDNGNYIEAIDQFDLALSQCIGKVSMREIEIDYYKAAAMYLCGDFDGAVEVYSAIIDYDSTLHEPYFLRGSMYLQQGQAAEAIADYKKACSYSKNDYNLYIEVYKNLSTAGEEKAGVEFLNTALAINDKSASSSLARGRIYLLMEQYDLAEGELTNARTKGVSDAAVYLAQVYKARGKDEQAASILQEYIDEGEAGSEAYNTMGLLYLEDGAYDKALNCFDKGLACERVTNEQSLLRNRVIALEYLGEFTEAKSAMGKYLSLYPKDEEAIREEIFLSTRGVYYEPPVEEPEEPEEGTEEPAAN